MTEFDKVSCLKCNGLFGILYDGEEAIYCPYCQTMMDDGYGLSEIIAKFDKRVVLKLVNVETNESLEQTGTCEMCMGTTWCDNPVFEFEDQHGSHYLVDGYEWCWGCYSEVSDIDNVVDFADWLSKQVFEPDVDLDYDWLDDLIDRYEREK